MKTRRQNNTGGSVLIITVLIAAVMFSIGVALTGILEKEVRRQLSGERSQRAINIADSALECVLYNDFRRLVFSSTSDSRAAVDCGSLFHALEKGDWRKRYMPGAIEKNNLAPGEGTYEFVIVQSNDEDFGLNFDLYHPCAYVTIKKECEGTKSSLGTVCDSGIIVSSIEVKGYNACKEGKPDEDLVRRFKIFY